MQERFKRLLEEKKLTATKFAALIKVNASAMSHILNGRSKPGFDVLDKIGQTFPDINLNWLITGNGNMYGKTLASTKTLPRQKELFEEEKEEILPSEVKLSAPVSQKIAEIIPPTSSRKKVKRIILFFEDNSFEDYEN